MFIICSKYFNRIFHVPQRYCELYQHTKSILDFLLYKADNISNYFITLKQYSDGDHFKLKIITKEFIEIFLDMKYLCVCVCDMLLFLILFEIN